MDFGVLGPLRVVSDAGIEIDLGGRNQRAVLAMLLSGRRRVVSRDRIIDAVWGDRLPADPANTLQHYVSRLRRVLDEGSMPPEVIVRVADGYSLAPSAGAVDADRFLNGVRSARTLRQGGASEEALQAVTAALAEWRGRPFDGLDIDALAPYSRELDDARLDAVEDLVDIRLGLGAHRDCLADLERLVEEHPLRERFWSQLMIALYRSGRQAEALRAYQRARRHLTESLGIEPGADLRSIEQRILTGAPVVDEPEVSTPLAVERPRGSLPVPPTRFVGRTATLAVVESVLSPGAVVTLLGASGTGKTRLAVEFGAGSVGQRRDGVYFVALDGTGDAAAVPRLIAAAVGLDEDPRRHLSDVLVDHLARSDAVIILDGCERIADACAALLTRVRRRPCRATFVVTSTVMLGVDGETRVDLPPMGAAGPHGTDGDGVELFVDRAQLVVPGWVPTPAELDHVRSIVRGVDGSPLAIELLSAQLATRSVGDVAGDLVRGSSFAPGGSASSRAARAAEWGIAQLADTERFAFERLSVFVQGFERQAADNIVLFDPADRDGPDRPDRPDGPDVDGLDVDDLIAVLSRRSLLRVDRLGDQVRYVVPSALRDIAWAGLRGRADSDAIRAAHAGWYSNLAMRADIGLRGPDLDRWVRLLDREQPNIRAALDWSVEAGRSEVTQRLAAALCRYWDWTGRLSEAMYWVGRAVEPSPAEDPWARTWLAIWAAYFEVEAGEIDTAATSVDDAIARAERSADLDQLTAAWGNRGIVHRSVGEMDAALADGVRALDVAESGASPWFRSWARSALAVTHYESGHAEESLVLAERALDGFRRLGDRASEAWSLDLLARLATDRGDDETAERHARHGLLNSHLLGARRNVASALHTLALIARDRGDVDRAVSLVSAAGRLTERDPSSSRSVLRSISAAAALELGPGRYASAWDRGRTLDLETILDHR